MRIFLKQINPAFWCSVATSVVPLLYNVVAYLFTENGDAKIIIGVSLAAQILMMLTAWSLIGWSMHDMGKREKEYTNLKKRIHKYKGKKLIKSSLPFE